MSTDKSPQSEVQMVPANGSTSANGESSCTATYQDLVQNADLFLKTLRDFHRSSGIDVKNPIICGKNIDLHRLFSEVTSRGGLDKVIEDRKCCEVIRLFNITTPSNAAFLLKKNYRKMLLEFEKMHYFQESENNDFKIDGVIDCKFEGGYIVTMRMGSEQLKGVIYHPTQTPVETDQRR